MPYENEHSCRLENPDKYDRFARKNCYQKHDGKCIDFIFGIKAGKSEVQAMRYNKDVWTEASAKNHCKDHEGTFEAAKKEANMEIERKSILVELKDAEPGAFVARIATLNVRDKDNDITLPGAFPMGKTVLISAYMHGSWQGKLPIGKAVIKEFGDEVLAEGQFNLKTSEGRETYEAVKFAPELQEWSYGFYPIEHEEGEGDDLGARILKKVDIKEISPVLIGAGINTGILAIKSEGTSYVVQAEAVLAAVNDLAERTGELAFLRLKEGRVLSTANRNRMKSLMESLSAVAADLKELLAETEPKDEKARLQGVLLLSKIRNNLEVI